MARRAAIPIAGRVVAITGGARGIGLATAEALSRRGAKVAIGDLDLAEAERAGERHGLLALRLDVTDRESFEGFLDAVEAQLGPLDVLINNAGVLHVGPFLEESDDWTRRQIDINLLGTILGMKLALPRMVGRGGGQVVNVGSAASKIGVRNEAVYSASKHGVYGVSEGVRHELRGTGVALSVVMPGLVRTDLAIATTDATGTVVLEPSDVAEAIVAAIERPRFDVFVPRSYSGITRVLALLPRRTGEAFLRAVGAERPTENATPERRAVYEERVADLYDRAKS